MSEGTKIQWCDDTHNFWRGCKKVSPGCAHCYAEVSTPVRVARSEGRELWGGTLRDRAKDFDAPLRWNEKPWVCDECGEAFSGEVLKPNVEFHTKKNESGTVVRCDCKTFHRRRIFSLSLGDWLDDAVPIEWLADMLDVIRRCPNLDFLLLTKRPENFQKRLLHAGIEMMGYVDGQKSTRPEAFATVPEETIEMVLGWSKLETCPPNVWIGTTVENQEYADKRIPELLKIPAVCRFLSVEPMLGPVDFELVYRLAPGLTEYHNVLTGNSWQMSDIYGGAPDDEAMPKEPRIHWVICGGESGPKARPFNVHWARSTVAQCQAAGVRCFVKQVGAVVQDRNDAGFEGDAGEWPMDTHTDDTYFDPGVYQGKPIRVLLRDKKGGDPSEWPIDLRVREFPNPHLTHER